MIVGVVLGLPLPKAGLHQPRPGISASVGESAVASVEAFSEVTSVTFSVAASRQAVCVQTTPYRRSLTSHKSEASDC
jgi:hypothetical protein